MHQVAELVSQIYFSHAAARRLSDSAEVKLS
jgi:hypothetical protein